MTYPKVQKDIPVPVHQAGVEHFLDNRALAPAPQPGTAWCQGYSVARSPLTYKS